MRNNLSVVEFEQFLDLLATDRRQAAEKYIALRTRLEKFFEWRDCENVEELTDIVFDRVTKKITQGEKINNVEAYCVSVAKFVLLENRREELRKNELDENSNEITARTSSEDSTEEDELRDRQMKCLEGCLTKLPNEQRKLLTDYFNTNEETLIPTRKRLAEILGITLNTLRIRVCRLKLKLEKCTKECFEKC